MSRESKDKRERLAARTPEELEAARRLKGLWRAIPRARRPTQMELAKAMEKEFGRGTQSLVSQYINGDIPLNLRATLFFAKELRCDPRDIREFPELRHGRVDIGLTGPPSKVEQELDREWQGFPAALKQKIIEAVRACTGRPPYPEVNRGAILQHRGERRSERREKG